MHCDRDRIEIGFSRETRESARTYTLAAGARYWLPLPGERAGASASVSHLKLDRPMRILSKKYCCARSQTTSFPAARKIANSTDSVSFRTSSLLTRCPHKRRERQTHVGRENCSYSAVLALTQCGPGEQRRVYSVDPVTRCESARPIVPLMTVTAHRRKSPVFTRKSGGSGRHVSLIRY
jgi:hypothetical protein